MKTMQTENIFVPKFNFNVEFPILEWACDEMDALFEACDRVRNERKNYHGATAVMIEDSNIIEVTEKGWLVQVDYYENN